MKPTTESIQAAHSLAVDINSASFVSLVQLAQAKTAYECSSPTRCKQILTAARSHLVNLRRTQTALLRHIDTAMQTAGGDK